MQTKDPYEPNGAINRGLKIEPSAQTLAALDELATTYSLAQFIELCWQNKQWRHSRGHTHR